MLIAELPELPLGVRDFVYMEDIGMLFLALSDMNISSRMDAFFTNIKLPWDKDSGQIIVGAVLGYKVTKGATWKFERLWVQPYFLQTNILAWCGPLNLLTVGMDDGFVHGLKVTAASSYTSHEEVFTIFAQKYSVSRCHFIRTVSWD